MAKKKCATKIKLTCTLQNFKHFHTIPMLKVDTIVQKKTNSKLANKIALRTCKIYDVVQNVQ